MRLPLINDLCAARPAFQRLIWKGVLFGAVFLILDRGLGWGLKIGLDRYYGLTRPAAVLCVGHSHLELGLDKARLESALRLPVAKFAMAGATTGDRLVMIRHYFVRHPGAVRAVVYGVDPHTFTSEGLSSASYRLLFPFLGDPGVREYVRRHCQTAFEYPVRRVFWLPRFNENSVALSARGWLGKWTNLKYGQVDLIRLQRQIKRGEYRRIAFDEENLRLFEETLRVVRAQGATLVLVYFPTVDVMNRAEPEKHAQVVSRFVRMAQQHDGVVFLDYNREYESRHELFYDPIHLNPRGQREVTERLAADLTWLLSGREGQTTAAQAGLE